MTSCRIRIVRAAGLAAFLLLLSCRETAGPPDPGMLHILSAPGQGIVATPVEGPVVVQVSDRAGRSMRNRPVTWAVTGGGGSVSAAETRSDVNGRAEVQWTLGSQAGPNTLTARLGTGAPVVISADGRAGAAATLVILSDSVYLGAFGDTARLGTAAEDAYGNVVDDLVVTWSVQPAGLVSIDATGLARALANGNGTITASGSGRTHAIPVRVVQQPTAVSLSPRTMTLNALDRTARFAAAITDRNGNPIVAAAPVMQSLDTAVITIEADGSVRSVGVGTARVRAMAGPAADTVTVIVQQVPAHVSIEPQLAVLAAGDSVHLTAVVRDSGSVAIPGQAVTWSSTNAAVVAVAADGWLRAVSAGTATVTAVSTTHASASGITEVTVSPPAGEINLFIEGMYITQATQTFDGSVPLVAGRDALLRVFVSANGANSAAPAVRVRLYRGASLIDTRIIQAPGGSVPLSVNQGFLAASWNLPLDAGLIQPGLRVLADVDPENAVDEANEADNSFPATGIPLNLDVRVMPPFMVRFVPVIQSANGLVGNVTDDNRHTYMNVATDIFPISSYDADVRVPYTFNGALPAQYSTNDSWSRLLSEMRLLRTAEASDRYYYGVLRPAYTSGGTGFGYIGYAAAIGIDWTSGPLSFPPGTTWRNYTAAHEWGHNFNRRHVDCGGPTGVDPNYPYANGRIGAHGYNAATGQLKLPADNADALSYCFPPWISDYTYREVLNFRSVFGGTFASGVPQRTLLVWGRISGDDIILEPSFEVVTRPELPGRPGPNRIEAVDASGARLFEFSFEATDIDHAAGEQHFAFAVPMGSMPVGSVAALRLSAGGRQVEQRRRPLPPPGAAGAAGAVSAGVAGDQSGREVRLTAEPAGRVRLEWDVNATPAIMVRDAVTGVILSILRSGVVLDAPMAELEIVTSDGVGSSSRRVRVPRF
ncbi:hypothetical protein BH23GEM9_BH23GEM9_33220 [soil metagenome]